MTFVNIALKNVKKKFSSYLIYFISITFAVMIFHIFCSMYYNPTFEKYRFGTGKMSTLFQGSSIAVLLFSTIFVLYAGGYFIKAQKKEIAIYSLLGMKKVQIAFMMFLETLFLGVCAVAFGCFIGYLLSGFFSRMLLRFMAEGTDVSMVADPRAVVTTLIAFCILFLFSGFRAYRTIYRYQLIDLLSATKQTEGLPGYSKLGALISVLMLAGGYAISFLIRVDISGLNILPVVFVASLLVGIGTFLLFRNLVPAGIALVKKKESFYFKTGNYISISQISFRLKANYKMLSVSAILTAITITLISASFSFYISLGDDATKCYSPFSFLAKNITQEQHEKLKQTVLETGDVSITSEDIIKLIRVTIQNDDYSVYDQELGALGVGVPAEGFMISEKAYLKILEETHVRRGTYSEMCSDFEGGLTDTTCYFIDGNAISDYCVGLPGESVNISFHDEITAYTISGSGQHKYLGALDTYKYPTVVVSDSTYDRYFSKATPDQIDTFYGFLFDDNMASGRTVDAMCKIIPDRFDIGGLPGNISYIGVYKANFALFGSYAFIGFFLGTLFLLSTGSVMYYKLIMEAQEEAPRYEILRKTGMTKREILISVIKQLGLVFGFPLVIGLVHTLIGLLFYNRALGEMGRQMPTLQNALLFVFLFILVYGVFYLMSIRSYFHIVWTRANGGRK